MGSSKGSAGQHRVWPTAGRLPALCSVGSFLSISVSSLVGAGSLRVFDTRRSRESKALLPGEGKIKKHFLRSHSLQKQQQ